MVSGQLSLERASQTTLPGGSSRNAARRGKGATQALANPLSQGSTLEFP